MRDKMVFVMKDMAEVEQAVEMGGVRWEPVISTFRAK